MKWSEREVYTAISTDILHATGLLLDTYIPELSGKGVGKSFSFYFFFINLLHGTALPLVENLLHTIMFFSSTSIMRMTPFKYLRFPNKFKMFPFPILSGLGEDVRLAPFLSHVFLYWATALLGRDKDLIWLAVVSWGFRLTRTTKSDSVWDSCQETKETPWWKFHSYPS